MTNYIKNKTALITGASAGMGKQFAIDLAKLGLNLVLVGRNESKLEEVKNEINKTCDVLITLITFDVRNKEDVNASLENLLKNTTVDILINNAGLALGLDPLDQGDLDQWENMIDTNIKGLLYVSRAIIPQMRKLETAHIVNIGSVAGKISYPNGNVYCATKAAVHSLGDSMNIDLYGTNVKVTTLAPGAVKTNFSKVRFEGDEDKSDTVYEGFTPLSAEDVSSVLISILNTPKHVNIQYLDLMPTAQRNPYMLYRDK